MQKLPKNAVVAAGLFLFLILFSVYLGFKVINIKKEQMSKTFAYPGTPTPILNKVLDQTKFNNQNYANRAGDETTGDPRLIQLRGKVDNWSDAGITIQVTDKTLTVNVPDKLMARCFPEMMTDAEGKTFKASDVYMDFSQAGIKGKTYDKSQIKSVISAGKDVTLQADLLENDRMEAVFIVGYGCSL